MSIQGQNSEDEIRELLDFSRGQQEGTEGILPGWLNLLIQGASFGTSDELLGGLRGMLSPTLTRQQGIDAIDSRERDAGGRATPDFYGRSGSTL